MAYPSAHGGIDQASARRRRRRRRLRRAHGGTTCPWQPPREPEPEWDRPTTRFETPRDGIAKIIKTKKLFILFCFFVFLYCHCMMLCFFVFLVFSISNPVIPEFPRDILPYYCCRPRLFSRQRKLCSTTPTPLLALGCKKLTGRLVFHRSPQLHP